MADKLYFVEYLDDELACKLYKERAESDLDSYWDVMEMSEVEVRRRFATKRKAVAWATSHYILDVFNMPRVVERTKTDGSWERTGYWESNGRDAIEHF